MKNNLLAEEVQQYIQEQLHSDINTLAFKKSPFSTVEMSELLTQIESKQKSKDKLPTWYLGQNILFPKKLSIEQTSSEECAKYKASLIQGNSLIDLTGGFGIDCYYFAKHIKEVQHCEMQEDLSEIVAHNYTALGIDNINCHCGDSLVYLKQVNKQWDYIYVDPARRNQAKEKVFFLSDCTPNVPEHLTDLFTFTNTILIKTSPLLDLHAGISELQHVKAIHIVALNNDVKELLWILEKGYEGEIDLVAVNLIKDEPQLFHTTLSDQASATFHTPQQYLYEPNSAILKTGRFDAVSQQYKINKLHPHSQLYTSEELINFPGRSFVIEEIIPFNKQNAKAHLSNIKANITVRNFPLKVEEIRKKWKIKDGGDKYIFFTTNLKNEKIIIICCKTT